MSTPRARMRSEREAKLSDVNKPVIGLRPLKERNKRSEAMIEEQLLLMRETQNVLYRTLENLEKALTEDEFLRGEKELQQLFDKSEELLVIVQVLMKIRNELAHARMDLERAIRGNCGVDAAKKRVKWLQDRLEKVLLTAKSYCHLYNRSLLRSKTPQSGLKDQISEKIWNKLSEGQQQLLLESEAKNKPSIVDDNQALPIVKEITKMQLPQTDSVEAVTVESEKRNTEFKDEGSGVSVFITDTVQQGHGIGPTTQNRKQRKRSDGSKPSGDNLGSNKMIELFPPTSPRDRHSDQESVTTAEPQSEPEDFDDHRSESIVSSVGVHEADGTEHDTRSVPTLEVTTPSDADDRTSPEHSQDVTAASRINAVEEEDDVFVDTDDEDKVEAYWGSDHHKFEWSDYMQSLDPRSWHALGLGIPESFLSKEKTHFDPDLPWKEKPMKVNSVIDVHKIALDKLLVRLHKMYDAIGQATQTTIDPATKVEKIETVMGKLDLEVEGPGSVTEKQQGTQPSISKQASRVSLPRIISPVGGQKSIMSMEKYPVTIHEPSAVRTARQNRQKLYPQQSSAWCDDLDRGNRMPRIVKVKSNPKLHRSKSVAQPRYLPRKQDSPKSERQPTELDLANESIWKPSMVMKIVTALKGFSMEREQSLLDRDGPKWKRIQILLGEGGILSSNSTIAAEAAKTIGQLKCHEKCVVDTLSHVIKLQRDPKVCYEACKAMILLGTWDPYAMGVIRQYIKRGNKDIVLELLSTMTKARDIAFVDKTTAEFKKLVNLLIFTIKTQSPEMAFHAAVSLGRLCVVEPVSKSYLISRLPGLSPHDKGEALYVLIKQMNCKDRLVIDALLEQLSSAYNWKLRMEAADLLIFMGARDVFKVKSPDEVFDTLERLLWDHANKELRIKVSEALSSLDLRQRAIQLVLRRLEDPAEEVRARAVISLVC
ncbi:unnamed protein product [Porites evermanni]|uniref:Uncharacterized protein n=1 Tax=Porites evermanni TaxID=104178 RepID=A0ABN8SXQ5_9CNID|nr:unnamed protein product [Porites evermanni]